MKKVIFSFLLLTSVWTFQACDNNKHADTEEHAEDVNEDKKSGSAEDDADFVVKAASGGMAEVKMGELAMQKGSTQMVKDFGKMMVDDHTKANNELMSIASAKNITLPTGPGEDYMKNYDDLNKLSGIDFDEKYMDMMVKDHKDDIKLFEDARDDAHDADIKAFAAKYLPTLQMHLQHAEGGEDQTDHNKDMAH
jgi:putative membrane protein